MCVLQQFYRVNSRALGLKHRLHFQCLESTKCTKGLMYDLHTRQRAIAVGWMTGHIWKKEKNNTEIQTSHGFEI